jgi:hypothetical protein
MWYYKVQVEKYVYSTSRHFCRLAEFPNLKVVIALSTIHFTISKPISQKAKLEINESIDCNNKSGKIYWQGATKYIWESNYFIES